MDPDQHASNAKMAQLVELLQQRGLVEVYTDEQGGRTYRLTDEGVRVGDLLASLDGEDADAVLEGLLRPAD